MLFGYPREANTDNWLHDCLVGVLTHIHESVRNGIMPTTWPNCIPAEHRDALGNHLALRDRVVEYLRVFGTLTSEERQMVHETLVGQNRVRELLAMEAECLRSGELPAVIQAPVIDLFGFAFSIMGSLGIRDRQYYVIYDRLSHRVCPFCGLERFRSPRGPRMEEDHYLPRSLYPFAAVNLWNLVPMGHECNSVYKRAEDLLWRDGQRRRAIDPFGFAGVQVVVDIQPDVDGGIGPHPDWLVSFLPPTPEVATWDAVFSVGIRYRRDVLESEFTRWIDEFGAWCADRCGALESGQQFGGALELYGEFLRRCGWSDLAFLKVAVVEVLRRECVDNNDSIIGVLKYYIGGLHSQSTAQGSMGV